MILDKLFQRHEGQISKATTLETVGLAGLKLQTAEGAAGKLAVVDR